MAEKKAKKVEETVAKEAAKAEKTAAKAVKKYAKKDPKVTVFVQYAGKEADTADILKAVKKDYTKKTKRKASEIKKIELYVKPEEGAVYYVVDGEMSDDYMVEF